MIVELGNFNIPVILNSNQFSLGFGMHDLQLAKPNLVNISNSLFFEMIFVFFPLRSTCFIFIETSTGRVVKCLPHVLNLTLSHFKVSEEKIVMQWRYKSWPEGTKFN